MSDSVKVTGERLVLSVAQDALQEPSDTCFTTFLMSNLAALPRWQVRSRTHSWQCLW